MNWHEVIKQVILVIEIAKFMAKSVWLTIILILFQFVIISEMALVDLNEKPIELETLDSELLFSSNTLQASGFVNGTYSMNPHEVALV